MTVFVEIVRLILTENTYISFVTKISNIAIDNKTNKISCIGDFYMTICYGNTSIIFTQDIILQLSFMKKNSFQHCFLR